MFARRIWSSLVKWRSSEIPPDDDMASQLTTKVVVKNLPDAWTDDYLQNFVEVVTPLAIADDGIQVFRNIRHTVLLTLEEPVSMEVVQEAEQSLAGMPFGQQTLKLEPVMCSTCSMLVHYTDPDLTKDYILLYFDNPQRSGCGKAEAEDCEVHPKVLLAVVQFSLPEGVERVVARGNHTIKSGKEVLKVEPWYEEFHRPLLQQLLAQKPGKPPVAPKPKVFHQSNFETFKPGVSVPFPMPSQTGPAVPPKADQRAGNFAGNASSQVSQQPAFKATAPSRQMDEPEVEKLRKEMERLVLKNERLEIEKQEKAHREEMERQQIENEKKKLKSENEKLKNLTTVNLLVPSYQLSLLGDFASQWKGCKITLRESAGEAVFYGTEEDCQEGKRQFLMRVQSLADDSLVLSTTVAKIFDSSKGRRYMDDIVQRYPRCSVKIQGSHVLLAAVYQEQLEAFKKEFQENIASKAFQIPSGLIAMPQFQTLKAKLEDDYLVMLTVPTEDSEDVRLDGLSSDVDLAVRELEAFTTKNRANDKLFHIPGALQGKACKRWFSQELDEIKQLILKNGEIDEEKTTDDGYTLRFQCRQEVLPEVMEKLDAIKKNIVFVKLNLNDEFPQYADRALLVNGLYKKGVGVFCSSLGEKLRQQGLESIGDFKLPNRCSLPQFRLAGRRRTADPTPRSGRQRHWSKGQKGGGARYRQHRHSSHGSSHRPALPCSVTIGGTQITVKSGDITAEQANAAVNVVGKDLNLKGTAIGSAFLKKCPAVAQALQTGGANQGGGEGKGCRLIPTPVAGGTLSMSMLFHAVLNKMPRHAVTENVNQLVQQSLLLAVQNGLTSIAFPPLGVGKRFGFGRYTTASAMMSAFRKFLEASPGSLQSITIVVFDTSVAGKFAEVLQQKLGRDDVSVATAEIVSLSAAYAMAAASPESVAVELEDDDSTDTDGSDDDTVQEEQEISDFKETPTAGFEAFVCTTQTQGCKKVVDILLKELKVTFLWHETIRDIENFKSLDSQIIEDIADSALKSNVHLSLTEKGLRLCGQKETVNQIQATISSKMYKHVMEQNKKPSDKRMKLSLPTDTDHLPKYWKVCRSEKHRIMPYDKACESWSKRMRKSGPQLNSVTTEEKAAVVKLVESTWQADKTGAGKDARNLTHNAIKVTKVQRLENPSLWQEYSYKREGLFQSLVHSESTSCSTLEKLPNSRGPVQTTANIAKDGLHLLSREIYQQINEHYLFHGTKADFLVKICGQGLDFRVAKNTMLGSGVYSAESSTKADQYTDPRHSRTGTDAELTMILLRVLLGEPFLHTAQNPSPFNRPPCRSCSQTEGCKCPDSRLFDSVIDDVRLFREFVVYGQHVCYPEYFITYQRI